MMEEKGRVLRFMGRSTMGGEGMRKICSALLALILLFSSAMAEELAGSWRFTGGGELLGEGFELYADGTGQLLYTEDYAVFPSRHFYAQDGNFTWQVQGDTLYLSFEDGREWNYPIHMEGDVLAVESLDTDGSGGYERYDEAAIAAWVKTAEPSPLRTALRDYLRDALEKELDARNLRSYEIFIKPLETGYSLELNAWVEPIDWVLTLTVMPDTLTATYDPAWGWMPGVDEDRHACSWPADTDFYAVVDELVTKIRADAQAAQEENERVRELAGTEERWTPNKYYPVYQGPGKSYGRSGGGKGKVSTNGVIIPYGQWQGWLLISYEISAGHHRFGWISEADVGPGAFAGYAELPFTKASGDMDYRLGVLTEAYPLTDDPGRTNSAVVTLAAGSSVHCLGAYGDWMLVEGFSGGKLAMGFVPTEIVDREHGYILGAERIIDRPVTYTKEEINAAMDVVEQAIYADWPGTHLLNMKYDEIRSNEEADWYADEGMQCMILYCDLNHIGLYDYEIGGAVAGDYEYVVRRVPGGEWELCNWGYR